VKKEQVRLVYGHQFIDQNRSRALAQIRFQLQILNPASRVSLPLKGLFEIVINSRVSLGFGDDKDSQILFLCFTGLNNLIS
jgi:hypothetical protein